MTGEGRSLVIVPSPRRVYNPAHIVYMDIDFEAGEPIDLSKLDF